VQWYAQLLGVSSIYPNAIQLLGTANGIALDRGVQMYFALMPGGTFQKTDDRPLGHIAFSVAALDSLLGRVKQMGITIVSQPAETRFGFRSFFVRGPQDVLVEFVEAGPIAFE
jgi:catechol 2,3-dioxygenase-like lactoylglutathione lyase family enzyme